MEAIQDAKRLIFTTWSSCSVSQDLLSDLQLECGWLRNATEWRASVRPAAKEWRSRADSKEETYNPNHISWLSENLRFLDISTPSHRSVPHIAISRHNSLSSFSLWLMRLGPRFPFPSWWETASQGAGLLDVLSLLQDPFSLHTSYTCHLRRILKQPRVEAPTPCHESATFCDFSLHLALSAPEISTVCPCPCLGALNTGETRAWHNYWSQERAQRWLGQALRI